MSTEGILKAPRTPEHQTSTEKYTAPSVPLFHALEKVFFFSPLGVSSCITVHTMLHSITRRRGGDDKLGDTIQTAAESRKLLWEIRIPSLRCAMTHCLSPPAVPLSLPYKTWIKKHVHLSAVFGDPQREGALSTRVHNSWLFSPPTFLKQEKVLFYSHFTKPQKHHVFMFHYKII